MKKFFSLLIGIVLFIVVSPVRVYAQAATLSLSPATGTFNQGCNFSLAVNLNTGGAQTDGTDAIIIYDATRFTATSIVSGNIYPDYPGNNIDAQSGRITVSGLASVSTPFSGQGLFATINFTVQSTASVGSTQINFDFDPNNKAKTTDSNVVQRVTIAIADVLNSVTNGSYIVGSTGTCGAVASVLPGTGQGAVSTPSAQTKKTLDQYVDQSGKGAGTKELTFTVAILGSVLTILGILGLALL